MISRTEFDSVKELHRKITDTLKGQSLPAIGTALIAVTANWLRQHHRPDLTEAQMDELRIQILMRFLKGVADDIGLGIEFGHLDDDPPTSGNA